MCRASAPECNNTSIPPTVMTSPLRGRENMRERRIPLRQPEVYSSIVDKLLAVDPVQFPDH